MMKALLCLGCVAAIFPLFAESNAIARWDPNMANAHAIVTNGVKWLDGRFLPLEGKAFADVEHYYDRLPRNVTTNVNEGVRDMKHHTAGMQFRFRTDSKSLAFKWTPFFGMHSMDHMPATSVSGIDVYRFDSQRRQWRYVKTGRIPNPAGGELSLPWTPGDACLVNLPLYNGIKDFALGIDSNATVIAIGHASGITKPVVFYGTSITHGGCCSRPGLAFPSIVGRRLDVPIVNLGFSGSGRGELEMSDHLAAIDASCYVIDCVWNMDCALLTERYEAFVRHLRAERPGVPIILADACDVYCGSGQSEEVLRRNRIAQAVYAKLRGEGWRQLSYLPAAQQHADDLEGTVDGVHPNDWGMMHLADGFAAAIRQALKLP